MNNAYKKHFCYPNLNSMHIDLEAIEEEVFQKKLLIAKEILEWFKPFFEIYIEKNVSVYTLLKDQLFDNFFISDEFLSPNCGFDHYSIEQRGLENVSKFFLYALKNTKYYKLELFTCISHYIQFYSENSSVNFYKKYKNAVIFKVEDNYYGVINSNRFDLGDKVDPGISCLLNDDIQLLKSFY